MTAGNINAAVRARANATRAAAANRLAPAPALDPAAVDARAAWRPELGPPQLVNRPGRPNNQPPPANCGLTVAQIAHNAAVAALAVFDSATAKISQFGHGGVGRFCLDG